MWRNLSGRVSLKRLKFSTDSFSILPSYSSVKFFERSNFRERIRPSEVQPSADSGYSDLGFSRISGLFPRIDQMGMFNFSCSSNPFSISSYARGLGSVAEAIDSTEEEEDCDEIQELIEEMNKVTRDASSVQEAKQQKLIGGMGPGKYHMLRRRQLKMETEAWQEAAKEYQELLADMCEQKLAPNLPYMKSLFLGWFEPLRDAIMAEQERCKTGRNMPAYGPYFGQLPADMMAVITMHKLMGLLMTGGGNGSARVIQAASHIGEAVELEGRIHRFLERTKKKNTSNKNAEEESDPLTKEQQNIRKKVANLMKKQKVHQLRVIVKAHNDLKPWGQEAQIKVGCRLIQLLMETAYIQPPVEQLGDGPPDIRPAFMHTLKTATFETQ
ncbi:male gametophyte defective 3 [Actinidia rufa]|uniref:Male gametophyte defective 3 n=1 Tax=Actinidia rufa TaxID=165716 RepID=A0A7J0ERP0_9ERIC|nr:male gametophyte defective 3 [Actinidia rufa]